MTSRLLYQDEAQISKGKPQWKEVKPPHLFHFPHNLIGSLLAANKTSNREANGTGFLISPTLVLTVAHTFLKLQEYLV